MADKFEELRTFVTVMSSGGINAAALQLGVAKSAVSRRVSDLEERLGLTLIARTTRSFEPTPAGNEYFERAKAILLSLDDLDSSAAATLGWRRVTISAPPYVIEHVLPNALAGASAALENVVLSFVNSEDRHPPNAHADIMVETDEVDGRTNRLLGNTVRVTCGSPTYLRDYGDPARPSDLRSHRLIAAGRETPADWRFSEPHLKSAPVSIVTPNHASAAAMAVSGLGLAQLPNVVAEAALANGSLVAVLADYATPPTRLIATSSSTADAVVLSILDSLAQVRTGVDGT